MANWSPVSLDGKVAAGIRNSPVQEPRLQGDSFRVFSFSGRDLAWSPGTYSAAAHSIAVLN